MQRHTSGGLQPQSGEQAAGTQAAKTQRRGSSGAAGSVTGLAALNSEAAGAALHLASRDVLRLQAVAGNAAVSGLVGVLPRRRPRVVQRQAAAQAPAQTAPITHRGIMLNEDADYLRATLERIAAEKGQDEAEIFANTFIGLDVSTKIGMQLRGIQPEALERVQKAVEIALVKLQNDNERFMKQFEEAANKLTINLLDASEKEINEQMKKLLTGSWGILTVTPETHAALTSAASALATKRRQGNRAGIAALKSQGAVQNSPYGPFLPAAQGVIDQYEIDRKEWYKQEQEYATLCQEKHRDQPVLAAYSWNDDGNAVERLDGLAGHGSGFFGRSNLAGDLHHDSNTRLANIAKVRGALNSGYSIWKQPRILDLTKKQMNASAMQGRLVSDRVRKIQEAEQRTAELRAAIAIGVGIAILALTGGAAVAGLAGFAFEAGIATTLAGGAQAFAAGMSIAAAYDSLKEYSLESAASATDYDKAKAIAAQEPSLLWLSLALVTAGLDVVAAGAAFNEVKVLLVATRQTGDIPALAKLVGSRAPKAVDVILPRAVADAEASGAIGNAILAEGVKFKGQDLGRLQQILQKVAGEEWADAYLNMASKGKIRPLNEDAIQKALGSLPPHNPKYSSLAEEYIVEHRILTKGGVYSPETGIIFLKEGSESTLAGLVVHEMTHALQGAEGVKYFEFWEEFEAYAAQRKFLQSLEKYGYQPSGEWKWLAEADDMRIAQHIKDAYGYKIPSSIVSKGGVSVDAELSAASVMSRIKSF